MGQELIQHDKAGALYIHRLTNWRFQDTASRMDTANQFKQADLDKMCYDMETEQYYMLQSINIGTGVPTWYPIPSSFIPTGESNTTSSAGGASLVLPKSGVDLPFKGLIAGTNVTFDVSSTAITINASLSGGPFAPLSHVGAGDAEHSVASGTHNGFMATTDYTLLHSLVSNATHTGDVTGSGALTIAAHAVTFDKFQAASSMKRLLGRGDSGAGDFQEIVLGTGLDMVGQTLSMSSVGVGDMFKATYDTDDDGVVNDSALLEGQDSAYHLARANHTGTQLSTTVSDFTEAVQDVVGATLVNGTNVTITYNDVANTITIASTSFEPIVAAGTTGQYYRGDKTWQTLDKTAVGLPLVDNTSDATKNAAVATLTNKVIDGGANSLQNIPQSAVLLDADLTAIAALVSAADKMPYATGAQTWALTDLSVVARQLIADTSFSAMRITLGLGTIATQDASAVAVTGGTVNGTTLGATTPAAAKVTTLDVSGNLTLSGTAGQRILGEFTTSTVANRAMFQTSTANSATRVEAIPSGSAATCDFAVYNNSDPTNAAGCRMTATATDARFESFITGSGSYLPQAFYNGGAVRATILPTGEFLIGTSTSASSTYGLQVASNNVYINAASGQASLQLAQAGTINGRVYAGGGAGNDIILDAARFGTVNGTSGTKLQHNASDKLATSTTGVSVTGQVNATTGTTLGNSSQSGSTVFDYYDEVSFTPAAAGLTSAGSASYSVQVGRATRRGNGYDFTLSLAWTGHTGTGGLSITGLPFTSVSTSDVRNTYSIYANGLIPGAGKIPQCYSDNNATSIIIQALDATAGTTAGITTPATVSYLIISGYIEVAT